MLKKQPGVKEVFYHPVDTTSYVDYKDKVPSPVCLSQVERKLKGNKYSGAEDCIKDLRRICANALRYNHVLEGTIREDAVQLNTIILEEAAKFCPVPMIPEWKQCVKVLDGLLAVESTEKGQQEVHIFLWPIEVFYPNGLPSGYDQKIKKRSDVATLTSRLMEGDLDCVERFAEEGRRMFLNCKTYWKGDKEHEYLILIAERMLKVFEQKCKQHLPAEAAAVARGRKQAPPPASARVTTPSGVSERSHGGGSGGSSGGGSRPRRKFKKRVCAPQDVCLKILNSIKAHEISTRDGGRVQTASPFLQAVDVTQFKDYLNIIEKPMDLKLVETNVQRERYPTMQEFHNDVMLIFDNALAYNTGDKGFEMRILTNKLKEHFEKIYEKETSKLEKERNENITPTQTSGNRSSNPRRQSSSNQKRSSRPVKVENPEDTVDPDDLAAMYGQAAVSATDRRSSPAPNGDDDELDSDDTPLKIRQRPIRSDNFINSDSSEDEMPKTNLLRIKKATLTSSRGSDESGKSLAGTPKFPEGPSSSAQQTPTVMKAQTESKRPIKKIKLRLGAKAKSPKPSAESSQDVSSVKFPETTKEQPKETFKQEDTQTQGTQKEDTKSKESLKHDDSNILDDANQQIPKKSPKIEVPNIEVSKRDPTSDPQKGLASDPGEAQSPRSVHSCHSSSSSSMRKERNRDRHKDRNRPREKDRDRNRDRDRKNSQSSRHRSRSRSNGRDKGRHWERDRRDLDGSMQGRSRNKDREKERGREREKSREFNRDPGRERGRERDRDRDRDRNWRDRSKSEREREMGQRERERERERRRDRGERDHPGERFSGSSQQGRDRSNRERDRERGAGRRHSRERSRERDRTRDPADRRDRGREKDKDRRRERERVKDRGTERDREPQTDRSKPEKHAQEREKTAHSDRHSPPKDGDKKSPLEVTNEPLQEESQKGLKPQPLPQPSQENKLSKLSNQQAANEKSTPEDQPPPAHTQPEQPSIKEEPVSEPPQNTKEPNFDTKKEKRSKEGNDECGAEDVSAAIKDFDIKDEPSSQKVSAPNESDKATCTGISASDGQTTHHKEDNLKQKTDEDNTTSTLNTAPKKVSAPQSVEQTAIELEKSAAAIQDSTMKSGGKSDATIQDSTMKNGEQKKHTETKVSDPPKQTNQNPSNPQKSIPKKPKIKLVMNKKTSQPKPEPGVAQNPKPSAPDQQQATEEPAVNKSQVAGSSKVQAKKEAEELNLESAKGTKDKQKNEQKAVNAKVEQPGSAGNKPTAEVTVKQEDKPIEPPKRPKFKLKMGKKQSPKQDPEASPTHTSRAPSSDKTQVTSASASPVHSGNKEKHPVKSEEDSKAKIASTLLQPKIQPMTELEQVKAAVIEELHGEDIDFDKITLKIFIKTLEKKHPGHDFGAYKNMIKKLMLEEHDRRSKANPENAEDSGSGSDSSSPSPIREQDSHPRKTRKAPAKKKGKTRAMRSVIKSSTLVTQRLATLESGEIRDKVPIVSNVSDGEDSPLEHEDIAPSPARSGSETKSSSVLKVKLTLKKQEKDLGKKGNTSSISDFEDGLPPKSEHSRSRAGSSIPPSPLIDYSPNVSQQSTPFGSEDESLSETKAAKQRKITITCGGKKRGKGGGLPRGAGPKKKKEKSMMRQVKKAANWDKQRLIEVQKDKRVKITFNGRDVQQALHPTTGGPGSRVTVRPPHEPSPSHSQGPSALPPRKPKLTRQRSKGSAPPKKPWKKGKGTWQEQADNIVRSILKHEWVDVSTAKASFLRPIEEAYPAIWEHYKTVIARPMDLGTVRSMLEEEKFPTAQDFVDTIMLVFNNALQFNKDVKDLEIREIVKHAEHLKHLTMWLCLEYLPVKEEEEGAIDDLDNDDDRVKLTSSVRLRERKLREQRISQYKIKKPAICRKIIKSMKQQNHWAKMRWFLEPPDLQILPGYEDVIDKPMDFKTCSKLLEEEKYENFGEFFADTKLIFENAIKYNGPRQEVDIGSKQAYQDAQYMAGILEKAISDATIEIADRIGRDKIQEWVRLEKAADWRNDKIIGEEMSGSSKAAASSSNQRSMEQDYEARQSWSPGHQMELEEQMETQMKDKREKERKKEEKRINKRIREEQAQRRQEALGEVWKILRDYKENKSPEANDSKKPKQTQLPMDLRALPEQRPAKFSFTMPKRMPMPTKSVSRAPAPGEKRRLLSNLCTAFNQQEPAEESSDISLFRPLPSAPATMPAHEANEDEKMTDVDSLMDKSKPEPPDSTAYRIQGNELISCAFDDITVQRAQVPVELFSEHFVANLDKESFDVTSDMHDVFAAHYEPGLVLTTILIQNADKENFTITEDTNGLRMSVAGLAFDVASNLSPKEIARFGQLQERALKLHYQTMSDDALLFGHPCPSAITKVYNVCSTLVDTRFKYSRSGGVYYTMPELEFGREQVLVLRIMSIFQQTEINISIL